MKKFKRDEPTFYTQTDHYVDQADSPFLDTYRGCDHIERDVIYSYPYIEQLSQLEHTVDNLYVPFAYNGTSFLNTNIKNVQVNHPYEPIGVLYFVLREYPKAFRQQVDGLCVTRDDFYDYRRELNKVVERVTDGKGSGAEPGLCSKDEMIRIASLFYIVHKTSNVGDRESLEWDEESRGFLNPWCGEKRTLCFKQPAFDHYVTKLQGVYASAIDWQQFVFMFADETDEDTLWFWNLPDFFNSRWFDLDDFVDLFNKLPVIDNRDGYIMLVCPKTDEIFNTFQKVLGFEQVMSRPHMYAQKDFALFDNMVSGLQDYFVIANYYPDASKNFKRFSEEDKSSLVGGV